MLTHQLVQGVVCALKPGVIISTMISMPVRYGLSREDPRDEPRGQAAPGKTILTSGRAPASSRADAGSRVDTVASVRSSSKNSMWCWPVRWSNGLPETGPCRSSPVLEGFCVGFSTMAEAG